MEVAGRKEAEGGEGKTVTGGAEAAREAPRSGTVAGAGTSRAGAAGGTSEGGGRGEG